MTKHLATLLLLLAACTPAASTKPCEYCNLSGGRHASFTSSPEWTRGEHAPAIRKALLAIPATSSANLESRLTCPRAFGPLPPAGKVRVLAPEQTIDEPGHKQWHWTIVSGEAFASGMVEMGHVTIHGRVPENVAGSLQDYVWSFTLTVRGETGEQGYTLSNEQTIRPWNAGSTGRVSQSKLLPEGHGLDALVAISAAELIVDSPGSAILATVDGNVIQLHLAESEAR